MRRIARSRRFTASDYTVHLLLGAVLLVMVLPFWHEIAKSLSAPGNVNAGQVALWPVNATFGNYYYYYRVHLVPLLRSFGVTTWITVVGTIWSVFFNALTAYPVSRGRRHFRAAGLVMGLAIFTIVFTPPIIPYFLTIRAYGLLNSGWAIILPHTVVAFHMIIIVVFFREIPEEIFDSCRMDGAGEFRVFLQIVLPLSKAVLATVAIFSTILFWNIFLHAVLFITDPRQQPLQIFVRSIFAGGGDAARTAGGAFDAFAESESIKSALVILTILPIAMVYPFLQKYFVKGIMIGSIK